MKCTVRCLCLLLLASSVCLSCGCLGGNQNPSYFPYLWPFGEAVPTHAKPPGSGYFANFDPKATRLEVRPIECTNPVRTQNVFIATVYDDKNEPLRQRRVEWMLEGEGNIIEVDEHGHWGTRGQKVSSKYGFSFTNQCEHQITRGNNNPKDDFVIRPGQTWCVVSAAREGDTHLTAYAPGIHEWDKGRVVVTCRWVDANWTLPPPTTERAGAEHVLTTNIYRHTDHQPLANYRVRYTIIDGPDAVFLPSRTKEFTATSDLKGNAQTTIVEVAPVPGINRIAVEVIRPPDPTAPSGAGIVLFRGETTVEWQAPSVALSQTGPPFAALGGEVTFTTTITNTGKIESKSMMVTTNVPDGLQFVRSTPPAFGDARQLIWTMGALQTGQSHTIQATYKTLKPGPITCCADLKTEEGFKDEKCATTNVTTPGLKVTINGPTSGAVGAPLNYQITVANTGSAPVENVLLQAQFDPGLEHEKKANPLNLGIGKLGPQESQVRELILTPKQVGQFKTVVTATADGGLTDRAEAVVTVQQPQLTLAIDGPTKRYMTRPAEFTLTVGNSGDVQLNNVVVRNALPPELAFVSAGQNGQLAGNDVVWNVGALGPRERKVLQLTTNCQKLSPSAVQQAVAMADGVQVQAKAAIEILGTPAFNLEVKDIGDPVQVGNKLTYEIKATNPGSLVAKGVEIKAFVPKEMRILQTTGASKESIAGQVVTFEKMDLNAGQSAIYRIEVQADNVGPGDVRFRVELNAANLTTPIVEEEPSKITPK
jgi:uncharacterized repeat protein (TIGR01451 family)